MKERKEKKKKKDRACHLAIFTVITMIIYQSMSWKSELMATALSIKKLLYLHNGK